MLTNPNSSGTKVRRKAGERLCAGRAGFTLIELLVVLSILAILGSLLLSAISRSKAKAYSTVCKSNLRQIGIGLAMFTIKVFPGADHGLSLPGRQQLPDGAWVPWQWAPGYIETMSRWIRSRN